MTQRVYQAESPSSQLALSAKDLFACFAESRGEKIRKLFFILARADGQRHEES
jgi:hypothetical protein